MPATGAQLQEVGFTDIVLINASWGLGELIPQGGVEGVATIAAAFWPKPAA